MGVSVLETFTVPQGTRAFLKVGGDLVGTWWGPCVGTWWGPSAGDLVGTWRGPLPSELVLGGDFLRLAVAVWAGSQAAVRATTRLNTATPHCSCLTSYFVGVWLSSERPVAI